MNALGNVVARLGLALTLLGAAVPSPAGAAASLQGAVVDFQSGRYDRAIAGAAQYLATPNLTASDQVRARELIALCRLRTGDEAAAKLQMGEILKLEPAWKPAGATEELQPLFDQLQPAKPAGRSPLGGVAAGVAVVGLAIGGAASSGGARAACFAGAAGVALVWFFTHRAGH